MSRRVLAALESLVGGIRAALPQFESAPPLSVAPSAAADPAVVRKAASRIAALLSDADPSAGEFVEANRATLGVLFDVAGWSEFEGFVQNYAFADALSRLEHALDNKDWSR